MNLLAISGSARAASTNTALLRALAGLAPQGVSLSLLSGLDALPIFNPDLEARPPETVRRFLARIDAADGLIISSPEYIRALPGGLKNAIDWLVSGEAIIAKPVALAHASHRGDDMLADLRRVLATVSTRFSPDIFLRVPLMKLSPQEVAAHLAQPEPRALARGFLADFAAFCAAPAQPRANPARG